MTRSDAIMIDKNSPIILPMIVELYRSAWRAQHDLFQDGRVGPWLLQCATPVVAFGRWQTARVATAGLNPSEREFHDEGGRELATDRRRFLHRTGAEQREPSDAEILEARRLAEGYFELGNAYTDWFLGFAPLLEELGCSYQTGRACHTDYVSPFTTRVGIGAVQSAARRILRQDGLPRWRALLECMPECRIVVGIGAGWPTIPSALGFKKWEPVPTPLDRKGGNARSPRPHLLHATHSLPQRAVHIFWWRPNRGEPLTYLDRDEKAWLGRLIRDGVGSSLRES